MNLPLDLERIEALRQREPQTPSASRMIRLAIEREHARRRK
jgi:hypothetical protein